MWGVAIRDGACSGGQGMCSLIGFQYGESIAIDPNSCVGDYACKYLGENNADTVWVHGSSCVNTASCMYLGNNTPRGILIGTGLCIGDNACESCLTSAEGQIMITNEDQCNV